MSSPWHAFLEPILIVHRQAGSVCERFAMREKGRQYEGPKGIYSR